MVKQILSALALTLALTARAFAATASGGGQGTDPTKVPLTGGTMSGNLVNNAAVLLSTGTNPLNSLEHGVTSGLNGNSAYATYIDVLGTTVGGLRMTSQDGGNNINYQGLAYSSGAFGGPNVTFSGRLFGGSEDNKDVTPSGATVKIRLDGYNGVGVAGNKASILLNASESWSSTGNGTDIQLNTTRVKNTSPSLALIVNSSGAVVTNAAGNNQPAMLAISTGTGNDISQAPLALVYSPISGNKSDAVLWSSLGSSITFRGAGGLLVSVATSAATEFQQSATFDNGLSASFTSTFTSVVINGGGTALFIGTNTALGNSQYYQLTPSAGAGLSTTFQISDGAQTTMSEKQSATLNNWASNVAIGLASSNHANPDLYINTAGQVGIGTTNPGFSLQVNSGASQFGLTISSNSTSGTIRLGQLNGVGNDIESYAGTGLPTDLILNGNSGGNVRLVSSGGTQLFYCNAGASTGIVCRGNGCSCAGGSLVGLGVFVP